MDRLATVVFDKTGTLTEGRPTIVAVAPADGFDEADLLRLAAGGRVGQRAPDRPGLRRASRRGCRSPTSGRLAAEASRRASMGVKSSSGRRVTFRTRAWTSLRSPKPPGRGKAQARTVLYVGVDGRPAGVIALADAIKPHAREVVDRLRGSGLDVVLLTGDNPATAAAVGAALGPARRPGRSRASCPTARPRRIDDLKATRPGRDGRRRPERRPGPGRGRRRHRAGHRAPTWPRPRPTS